jgi:hypothetical protein
MDTMTNRHAYKSVITNRVAVLDDSFAAVFGDRLTRVDDEPKQETPAEPVVETPTPANTAANPDNLTASKEDK